jgi:hypothetical protein
VKERAFAKSRLAGWLDDGAAAAIWRQGIFSSTVPTEVIATSLFCD